MKSFIKLFVVIIMTTAIGVSAIAQSPFSAHPFANQKDVYAAERAQWLKKAESLKPELIHTILHPVSVVKAVNDSTAFQGWRFDSIGTPDKIVFNRSFKDVKKVTLDFGRHATGYFTFNTLTLSRCQDAPIRIKFTFGELPAELNTPLDPWTGTLSRAWMQDEVVTVTEVDRPVTLPRRMACRYVDIELLGASNDFDFAIDSLSFDAVSSADHSLLSHIDNLPPLTKKSTMSALKHLPNVCKQFSKTDPNETAVFGLAICICNHWLTVTVSEIST